MLLSPNKDQEISDKMIKKNLPKNLSSQSMPTSNTYIIGYSELKVPYPVQQDPFLYAYNGRYLIVKLEHRIKK